MSKADCQKAFEVLLKTCAIETPSLGRQKIVPIKKRTSPKSGWICYLKTCNKEEPEMNYKDCMKDVERKELTYKGHEVKWKQEALAGCPSAEDPLNV